MDGLLIIAVVLLVVVGVYLLLDRLLRNDERRRAGEVRRQAVKEVVPVRLRAYERLALFLERTKPDTLLPEVVQPGMTCLQLHAKLLETIRREYGHNVSQQLYVGDEVWQAVVAAKESLMRLENMCAASCSPADGAEVLAGRIIQAYAEASDPPTEVALARLKAEVSKMF